jgi:hypothetical protein
MFEIITLAAATAATLFGYVQSRRFVRNKLRYVDKVHGGAVPVLAGGAALLLATPVVALLPLVGMGTAILFGVGVGTGVAAGRSDNRHRRIGSGS